MKKIGIVTSIAYASPMRYYVDRGFDQDGDMLNTLEDESLRGWWYKTKHQILVEKISLPVVFHADSYHLAILDLDSMADEFMGILFELPKVLKARE